MKIKPLGDHVVIKPVAQESKTLSGLIIPDTAKEKSRQGEVLAIGSGRYENGQLVPMTVKVGDTVLYKEYGGDEYKLEGKEVVFLEEKEILAILEK